jgi:hypothetical protein
MAGAPLTQHYRNSPTLGLIQMSTGFQALLARVKVARAKGRLARAAQRATSGPTPVTVRLDPAIPHVHDAVIRRDGTGLVVSLSDFNPEATRRHGPARLPAYLHWLRHSSPQVGSISVTLSDGDLPSAATFSPSTFLPDVTLLPDPIFFASNGYAAERRRSLEQAAPWSARSSDLVWRGGMNSMLSFDVDLIRIRPDLCSQRLLACVKLQGVPDTDVKFATARQRQVSPLVYDGLGLLGQPVEQSSWLTRKYALDIDGHSNAWSNLFTRLLFGCCVLKVESRFGYRQWYYDRLRPWEHYIPVAADLSDIEERLDWARSNDSQCQRIAQQGRQLALEMTLSAATLEAARSIEANWQRERQ